MKQATPAVKRRLVGARLHWAIVGLAALLLLAVLVAVYYRYAAPANATEKNDVARTVVQGLGALALLLALFFTWRNVQIGRANLQENQQANLERERLGQESRITERFTKAVEQLGSERIEVRLGGIYALERIAKDSPRDHPTIMDILAAFVREHARREAPEPGTDAAESEELPQHPLLATDVQAVLTVIGRRSREHDLDGQLLNLHGTYLPRADLVGAHLEGALLYDSQLDSAFLPNIHLEKAGLARTFLRGTFLGGAYLDHAKFLDADLSGAILVGAHAENTDFRSAALDNADLNSITLRDVTFIQARLPGASFVGAKLYGVRFDSADLTGAHFADAQFADVSFADAILDDAKLANVDLSQVGGLTREQLGRARLGPGVVLPDYLRGEQAEPS